MEGRKGESEMKRAVICLALLMAFGLSGCGKKSAETGWPGHEGFYSTVVKYSGENESDAKYLEIAQAMHISPEAFHRVATVASGGLDSLPHCGAVITLLAVCGLTHKDSYADIGIVTCVIPILAVAVIVVMGSLGIV